MSFGVRDRGMLRWFSSKLTSSSTSCWPSVRSEQPWSPRVYLNVRKNSHQPLQYTGVERTSDLEELIDLLTFTAETCLPLGVPSE